MIRIDGDVFTIRLMFFALLFDGLTIIVVNGITTLVTVAPEVFKEAQSAQRGSVHKEIKSCINMAIRQQHLPNNIIMPYNSGSNIGHNNKRSHSPTKLQDSPTL